ncbi:MAG: 30S ribosomal protein S20 [Planctomycetota bacterium]
MPHSKSAKKRHKQSEGNRAVNRSTRSMLKTLGKKVRESLKTGNVTAAEEQLKVTAARLDRAASKGVIHRNTAARTKSRLQHAIKSAKGK